MSDVLLPGMRPATTGCLDDLEAAIGGERVWRDPARRKASSTDHAWLSPVLTMDLPDRIADVVVVPRCVGDLKRIVAIAYEHDVALTVRGKGTGNYGQSVPLAGGIVVETFGMSTIGAIEPGWVSAQTGVPFTRLEAAARATGQELALFPTTTTSLLGGFLSGGAGGIGTCEHGFIWDGYVDEVSILPVWAEPELLTYRGSDAQPHLHTYGTTGILTSAKVKLVPARIWTALFASFGSLDDGAAAMNEAVKRGIGLRDIAIDDPAVVARFPAHRGMPANLWSMRAIVDVESLEKLKAIVRDHNGMVEAEERDAVNLLVSLTYNHVTMRMKRADPSLCHLQVSGPKLVDRMADIRKVIPDAMMHVSAQRRGGQQTFGSLVLSRFTDRETLQRQIAGLRSSGLHVVDPHTWRLDRHGEPDHVGELARHHDPKGLLNPGKL